MRDDNGVPMTEQDFEDHYAASHPNCERCKDEVCFCSSDGCPHGVSADGFRRDGLVWCGEVCYEAAAAPDHVDDEPTEPIPVRVDGVSFKSWKEAEEAPRCEFCGELASDERDDRGRTMSVCDACAEDVDRAAEMDRRERAYDAYVDQKLSEWKEGR